MDQRSFTKHQVDDKTGEAAAGGAVEDLTSADLVGEDLTRLAERTHAPKAAAAAKKE